MGRINIALLTDSLFEEYQIKVWRGIHEFVRGRGWNLITLAGGYFNEPEDFFIRLPDRLFAYDFVKTGKFDGVILLASSIGSFSSDQQLIYFLKSLGQVPVVIIGKEIPGFPSVLIDNYRGMYNLVLHFIRDHGYSQIAFVTGPQDNKEASDRFRAYRDALKESGIPYNPSLVISGRFIHPDGIKAVEALEHIKGLEAIIAANDIMALGVLEALSARHISVPLKIAVGGYDDFFESDFALVPLSTVRQPVFQSGSKAAELLEKMIEGEDSPGSILLECELIIRRSCGCYIHKGISGSSGVPESLSSAMSPEEINKYFEKEMSLLHEMVYIDDKQKESTAKWTQSLSYSFLHSVEEQKEEIFLNIMENFIFWGLGQKVTLFYMRRVLELVFMNGSCYTDKVKDYEFVSRLFQIMNSLIGRGRENLLLSRYHDEKIIKDYMLYVYQSLNSVLDSVRLIERFASHLAHLRIKSCYIVFFTGREKWTENGRLVLAYRNHVHMEVLPEFEIFPVASILPPWLISGDEISSQLLIPLCSGKDQFGYIVFDADKMDSNYYEVFAAYLGSALKNISLYTRIQEYSVELEKMVEKRTAQLKETQARLVESAHKAGMAEIASQVVHNIGNILTSIVVEVNGCTSSLKRSKLNNLLKANEMLAEQRETLGEFFGTNDKGPQLVEYYILLGKLMADDEEELSRSMAAITEKTDLIGRVIDTLDSYTGVTIEEAEIDLLRIIEDSLLILNKELIQWDIDVRRNYSPRSILIPGQRNKFLNIFLSLFSNCIHALKDFHETRRTISIETHLSDDYSQLCIRDNGEGIPPENMVQIFNHGFSTWEGRAGFGLHNAANAVKELGGKIEVFSDGKGKGAVFYLSFPVSGSP